MNTFGFDTDFNLAIEENKIETLTLELINIADNLSIIFDQIDEKFDTLQEHLKCEAMGTIKEKYQSLKANYSIIKSNAISYSEDMRILNEKMKAGQKYLSSEIESRVSELNSIKELEVK